VYNSNKQRIYPQSQLVSCLGEESMVSAPGPS